MKTVPAVIHALDATTQDVHLTGLLQRATPEEQKAVVTAIKVAYQSGQDASDARCAKMMTRIFSTFIGVTPGVDLQDSEVVGEGGSRVRAIVKMLAQAARK